MNVVIRNISKETMTLDGIELASGRRAVVPYTRFIDMLLASEVDRDKVIVEKGRNVPSHVSADEFGARGDGMADDTLHIQSAVDYLEENGGGTLDVPAGIYLTDGISMKAPTVIRGAGRDATVLKLTSDGSLFEFSDAGSCSVERLSVYGSGSSVVKARSSSGEQGVSLDGVHLRSGSFTRTVDIDTHSHITGGVLLD